MYSCVLSGNCLRETGVWIVIAVSGMELAVCGPKRAENSLRIRSLCREILEAPGALCAPQIGDTANKLLSTSYQQVEIVAAPLFKESWVLIKDNV